MVVCPFLLRDFGSQIHKTLYQNLLPGNATHTKEECTLSIFACLHSIDICPIHASFNFSRLYEVSLCEQDNSHKKSFLVPEMLTFTSFNEQCLIIHNWVLIKTNFRLTKLTNKGHSLDLFHQNSHFELRHQWTDTIPLYN